jgi:hypothetical protein
MEFPLSGSLVQITDTEARNNPGQLIDEVADFPKSLPV